MHDDLNQFSQYQQRFEELISGKYPTEIEKMFYLCKNGYLNVLKFFLQDSNDKNPQDDDKYSILHCAVEHGKVDIVEYLVPLLSEKNPCAVSRVHSNEDFDDAKTPMTPLQMATMHKNLPIVKVIAPHVSDCLDAMSNLRDMDLLVPFLKELEKHELEPEHGHPNILEYLVSLWYKEIPKKFITELIAQPMEKSGFQDPLFYLCTVGSLYLLRPLLEDLEDKNAGDKDKYTLLHCAVENGQLNIVEYLLPMLSEKNPSAGPRQYSNGEFHEAMTPLRLAAMKKNLPIAKVIAPHANDSDYLDTMFYLCETGCLDLLRPLLEGFEDKHAGDKDKYKLLKCAVENHQLNIVEYLVSLLSEIGIDEEDKKTLLQIAFKHSQTQILEQLATLCKEVSKSFVNNLIAPLMDGSGFQDPRFYLSAKGPLVWLKLLLDNWEEKNTLC